MKNKTEVYAKLRNLEDIQYEKTKLRNKIKKQELIVEQSWDTINNFWSFIPKITRTVNGVVKSLPIGLNLLSFITGLLSNKKK